MTSDGALPARAPIVVIGGGVVGLSTAYHLARAGVDGVVLVERTFLGEGSTCRSAGGVRAQFSDRVNVLLGQRSLETFEHFGQDFGQEIDLHRVGYLFLLDDQDDVRRFTESVQLQNDVGVPSRMISVAEATRLSPLVRTDGLIAAAFSPSDGHCTPESVVLGYAQAARRLGVRIITGCAATGVDVEHGRLTGVRTTQGDIATAAVVCAAGAWSKEIGSWAGVDLPIEALCRQIVVTEPIDGLDPATPFTIDFSTSLYFHREAGGLLLGMSEREDRWGFDVSRSPDWLPDLAEAIDKRIPGIGEAGISAGWAGLYEMTPDHNALVGETPAVSRFLYATGFSGHGFLMGPAVGEVVSDLYLGRQPCIDVSMLDARRFEDCEPRPELNIV